jgi:polynucleotide 5'-kinase involved in rRNA processing
MEKKEDKVNNFEKYKKYLNLRLSLIGGQCSGKKTLSIYLKNKYNIEPINLEEILS